ncbi:hypothetical protein JXI42_04175 [bacterium]|nr:hypothetical protein [bacterium]
MKHKELVDEITFELGRIDELFSKYSDLLEKVRIQTPDFIELSSLSMFLHSFYNGLENIFRRIAKRFDNTMPNGEDWRKILLEQMSKPGNMRKEGVISKDTYANNVFEP